MSERAFTYPETRQDNVIDNFHGTDIADPYRWLEDPAIPEARAWTEAQNTLTRSFLDGEKRERILSRLKKLSDYQRWSAPQKRGNRYFFWRHDGLQNQPVLFWQNRFTDDPHPILNPNTLSKQGIVSVMNAVPSLDGNHLAYSLSQRGSDWQEVRIRKVLPHKMEDWPEILLHTKFSGIAWHPNHTGFFYNRYPDPGTVPEADQSYYNKVYWHELGTDQVEDRLIYERPDQKDFDFWPQVSEDGKYLILTIHLGTDRRNRVYYRALDSDADFIRLLDSADAHYRFIGNEGDRFFFFTDNGAPKGSVVAIDIKQPEPEYWQTVISEQEDTLTQVLLASQRFVAVYLHHAHHKLFVYRLDGEGEREIKLPGIGSIGALNGKRNDDELFISFSSFLFPARAYLYNFKDHVLDDVFTSELHDFDPEAYTVHQEFCLSKDGTQIPMFLVYRKDLEPLSDRPVMMYGYGGFRNALTPTFSATLLPWLEQGGIYCQVNTRGGSEYGTEWYRAGTLERKQNVFDDFQAAGDHLVKQGWTSPEKMVIRGGSNGGLLVAACMLQRPDLYAAVICQVPVIDMLRYHRFTIGRYWVSDYGNAEANPEDFQYMLDYSPLHNVVQDQKYPAVLITSADHDDRVVPAHAKKFAATLQARADQTQPVLLRVDTDAGHGAGKPMTKMLEETADIYAFISQTISFGF